MTQLVMAHEMLQCCTRQPRVMIVKSKKLYSLSRRLIHSHKLFDGSSLLPSEMARTSEPVIIAAMKVEEYRNTHTYLVKETDAILEVGCHFGVTTKLLEKTGRFCIGVDIGRKSSGMRKSNIRRLLSLWVMPGKRWICSSFGGS